MIRWNIGRVGCPRLGACIGHVEFMLFVSISFVLGSQHEHGFWWNMGLTVKVDERKKQTMSSNSLASYRGKKLLPFHSIPRGKIVAVMYQCSQRMEKEFISWNSLFRYMRKEGISM